MKTSLQILGWIIGICVGVLICLGVGFYIASIFPAFSRTKVLLTFVGLCSFYVYLLILAKLPMNDGLSSDQVAFVYSIALAIAATSIIVSVASVGNLFFLVNSLVFLVIITIQSIVVYQNQDIVPYGNLLDILYVRSNRKLAGKLKQDIRGNPSERPCSERLADLALSIINTSGVITAVIAFTMYQLGWFVQR